ncbi:unnamed protein product [Caenorhabditis auriculariae]|uniref:Uncharacterized protein n=1 Tax=Caenorhabditis auriculariae TaxID=2777116 RepID=A0A8S1HXP4_9PELO|nr:unnamed protein product [Caenorhabditis auriculariae]
MLPTIKDSASDEDEYTPLAATLGPTQSLGASGFCAANTLNYAPEFYSIPSTFTGVVPQQFYSEEYQAPVYQELKPQTSIIEPKVQVLCPPPPIPHKFPTVPICVPFIISHPNNGIDTASQRILSSLPFIPPPLPPPVIDFRTLPQIPFQFTHERKKTKASKSGSNQENSAKKPMDRLASVNKSNVREAGENSNKYNKKPEMRISQVMKLERSERVRALKLEKAAALVREKVAKAELRERRMRQQKEGSAPQEPKAQNDVEEGEEAEKGEKGLRKTGMPFPKDSFVIRLCDIDSINRSNEIWRVDNHILMQKFTGVPSVRIPARQFQQTNRLSGYDMRAGWRFYRIDPRNIEIVSSEVTIHDYPDISVLREAKKASEERNEEFKKIESSEYQEKLEIYEQKIRKRIEDKKRKRQARWKQKISEKGEIPICKKAKEDVEPPAANSDDEDDEYMTSSEEEYEDEDVKTKHDGREDVDGEPGVVVEYLDEYSTPTVPEDVKDVVTSSDDVKGEVVEIDGQFEMDPKCIRNSVSIIDLTI